MWHFWNPFCSRVHRSTSFQEAAAARLSGYPTSGTGGEKRGGQHHAVRRERTRGRAALSDACRHACRHLLGRSQRNLRILPQHDRPRGRTCSVGWQVSGAIRRGRRRRAVERWGWRAKWEGRSKHSGIQQIRYHGCPAHGRRLRISPRSAPQIQIKTI